MNSNWKGVYGQEFVKGTLESFINSDKVPHALLFIGQEGIGKDFTAIKFAQYLNVKSTNYPIVSKAIASLSEPYIKYIVPLPRGKNEDDECGPYDKLTSDEMQSIKDAFEEKGKNPYVKLQLPRATGIKISSIRDIKKFTLLEYSDIIVRVVLISQAHLMNEEAQNALLKNLEEPPPGIIFLLTTPYPDLLRETIRSRCWIVKFHPLNEENIKDILTDYFKIDEKLSESVAPFAGGSVTGALQFLNADFEELIENVILFLRYSFGKKYNSAFSIVDKYIKQSDKESLKLLVQMVLNWFNDLERYRNQSEVKFFKNHKDTFEKFNVKFPGILINNTVGTIEKLISSFGSNINPSVIMLRLTFELSSLIGQYKII